MLPYIAYMDPMGKGMSVNSTVHEKKRQDGQSLRFVLFTQCPSQRGHEQF
jgi:hypothetical protein